MSSFIRSMPSAGLIEMPPVSNVMPLPTRPSTGPGGAPGGLVAEDHQAGRLVAAARDAEQQTHAELLDLLLVEHLEAPGWCPRRSRPIAARTRAASASCPGSLDSSRDRLLHSPSSRPRRTASSNAAARPSRDSAADDRPGGSCARRACRPSCSWPTSNSASVRPSATACASSAASMWLAVVRAHHECRARHAPGLHRQPAGRGELARQVAAEGCDRARPRRARRDGRAMPGRERGRGRSRKGGPRTPSHSSARARSPPVAASSPGTAAAPRLRTTARSSTSVSTAEGARRRARNRAWARISGHYPLNLARSRDPRRTMRDGTTPASGRKAMRSRRRSLSAGVACLMLASRGGRRPQDKPPKTRTRATRKSARS